MSDNRTMDGNDNMLLDDSNEVEVEYKESPSTPTRDFIGVRSSRSGDASDDELTVSPRDLATEFEKALQIQKRVLSKTPSQLRLQIQRDDDENDIELNDQTLLKKKNGELESTIVQMVEQVMSINQQLEQERDKNMKLEAMKMNLEEQLSLKSKENSMPNDVDEMNSTTKQELDEGIEPNKESPDASNIHNDVSNVEANNTQQSCDNKFAMDTIQQNLVASVKTNDEQKRQHQAELDVLREESNNVREQYRAQLELLRNELQAANLKREQMELIYNDVQESNESLQLKLSSQSSLATCGSNNSIDTTDEQSKAHHNQTPRKHHIIKTVTALIFISIVAFLEARYRGNIDSLQLEDSSNSRQVFTATENVSCDKIEVLLQAEQKKNIFLEEQLKKKEQQQEEKKQQLLLKTKKEHLHTPINTAVINNHDEEKEEASNDSIKNKKAVRDEQQLVSPKERTIRQNDETRDNIKTCNNSTTTSTTKSKESIAKPTKPNWLVKLDNLLNKINGKLLSFTSRKD